MSVVPKPNFNGKVNSKNRKTDKVVEDDSSSDRAEVVFLASKDELVKIEWFLDSGATDHMVNDSGFFTEMRRLERPVEVMVANGQRLLAEYCGDMVFYAIVSGSKKKCEAKNVLYLPELSCNLFSVSRVARSGLQVSFAGDRAEIKKEGAVMAVGHYKGKQYQLNVLCKRRDVTTVMMADTVIANTTMEKRRSGYSMEKKDENREVIFEANVLMGSTEREKKTSTVQIKVPELMKRNRDVRWVPVQEQQAGATARKKTPSKKVCYADCLDSESEQTTRFSTRSDRLARIGGAVCFQV